jgi:hypothetical protein
MMCTSDLVCRPDNTLGARPPKVSLWGVATRAAAVSLALLLSVTGAYARSGQEKLTGSLGGQALTPAQLDELRGGWINWNGALVEIGLNIKLVNNGIVVVNTPLQNSLTQSFNSGATNLSVTTSNGSIQTVIQNSANNQAIQSITTMDVVMHGGSSHLSNFVVGRILTHLFQFNAGMTH